MNDAVLIISEEIFNKINCEFPKQKIITRMFLTTLISKLNLDKNKIKQMYQSLRSKIKTEYNSIENSILNGENINNDNIILNLIPFSKNLSNLDNQKKNDTLIDYNANHKKLKEDEKSSVAIDNIKTKNFNDIEFKKSEFSIEIYNNFRDTNKDSSSNNFSITFSDENKLGTINKNMSNIISINLSEMILLDSSIDDSIPLIYISISEIKTNRFSNNKNDNLKKSLTILSSYNLVNKYRHYRVNKQIDFNIPQNFDSFTFSFFDHNGNLLDFNEDNEFIFNIILNIQCINPNFSGSIQDIN